jgi:hypothetical protein
VSLFTAEAEYVSSVDAAKQAFRLQLLLEDLGFLQSDTTSLYKDIGAILLSQNLVHHDSSKHIPQHHHYLWEQVGDKTIELMHVLSKENRADIFTKSLSTDLFLYLQNTIEPKNHLLIK